METLRFGGTDGGMPLGFDSGIIEIRCFIAWKAIPILIVSFMARTISISYHSDIKFTSSCRHVISSIYVMLNGLNPGV